MSEPVIDVRPDIAQGKEPLSRILAAARDVPAGGSFVLLAPFEPAPLYKVLGREGFTHSAEPLGAEGFRVRFTREGGGPAA